MQTGISTASLFNRFNTEDALLYLSKNNVECVEVFLETYREYNKEFGEFLKTRKGNVTVNSIHTLTTQFEPQLYSINQRAQEDSFELLEGTLQAGKALNAKNYTFHGSARIKRTPLTINFERHAELTQRIIDTCAKYDITLAYENVHWCYYNYIGFFKELKSRTKGLKGTLDIKQARQSGIDYREFLKEMGEDIVTVHLSDIDCNGKMCLPGKGTIDFNDLFTRLKDVGFNGSAIIEAYQNDYDDTKELFESLDYLNELRYKIFK